MKQPAVAGDQFSFSLIYLRSLLLHLSDSWGSILVFPDILETEVTVQVCVLGINSRFP